MKRPVILLVGLLICARLLADDVSGTDKLLCAASRVIVCYEVGDCEELAPAEVNIPQFVVVDTRAKTITTTRSSKENRSTPIQTAQRADGLLSFQGLEQGRAFSFVVHEQTGYLTVAVSRDGLSVSVFGACTDADL